MKHIPYFIILLVSPLSICSQNSGGGFHYVYNLSSQSNWGTRFSNVLFTKDTLWILGNIYTSESVPYEAITLAKVDTFGNYLDQAYYYLPDDDILIAEGNDLIQLQNGNFASVGTTFAGRQASLTTYNDDGQPAVNTLYGINGALTLFGRRLLEVKSGGYMIGGIYQKTDYTLKGFIKRISPSGNQIWSRSYGIVGQDDLLQSLIQIDNNTYLIGGMHASPPNTPIPQLWAQSWIFAVDSMGLTKWEWVGPINDEVGVVGLQKTGDNGWIYLSSTTEVISQDEVGTHMKVIRRDSTLNLLWERTISDLGPTINRFGDLVHTPDGNWVASGTWIYRTGPGQDDVIFYSSLYKLNDQGDTLWSVRLKGPPGFEGTAYPGGMTVLPSGSVVWALRFDRFSPGPPQSFGWLIKVDNDGCVDTLCQLSTTAPEPLATPLMVYPNPAQTSVTFEWPDQSSPAQISIFDMTGSMVWTQPFHQKTVWEVADMPGGVYFYTVSSEGALLTTGKISLIK